MRVASSIFGVAVAAFLVALCPDALCTPQFTATPVCPPDDNGEVILYPKPDNCSEFYQCAGGVAFTHHCPPNLFYCAEKQYCAWRDDAQCAFDCTFTKTNPVPAVKEQVPAAPPQCPPLGEGDFMLLPNAEDCSSFYDCDNGSPVLMYCPQTLYFCPEQQNCFYYWTPGCTYNCLCETCDTSVTTPTTTPTTTTPTTTTTTTTEPPETDTPTTTPTTTTPTTTTPTTTTPTTTTPTTTTPTTTTPTTTTPTTTTPFQPVCPPSPGDGEAVLIPNPDDCTEFFDCTYGTPIPSKCPDNLYFCAEKETCDWVTDGECSYNCVGIKSKPVIVEEKFIPKAIECPPDRNDTVTLIPDPTNCTVYYLCDNGVAKPEVCPTGLHYCAEKATCDWPYDTDCKSDCFESATTVGKPNDIAEQEGPLNRWWNRWLNRWL